MGERDDNRFIKNAAILSVAGIFVRALGAIYRIPLARIAGEEITGLYQMAYPIYSTLLAVSTTGPPIAIAKMVAERVALKRYKSAQQVFRLSLLSLGALGLFLTLLLALVAPYLVENVLGDQRAVWSLWAMAPAIVFISLVAVLRGYFQGLQQLTPYAFSQMAEQIVRVGVALGLGLLLLSAGNTAGVVAGGISSGVSLGGLVALLLLLVAYSRIRPAIQRNLRQDRHPFDRPGSVVREFAALAVPITIGGIVMPLMQLIDAAVVPRRLLAAGFSQAEATGLYGQLSGMAAPLINLPQMFTVALVASLIPSIAEAMSLGRKAVMQQRSTLALKLAMLFNLPAAIGLSVLATPIGMLLYGEVGAGVGRPLSVLALVVAFLAVQQTTSGVLQGLGKTHIPVVNLFLGGLTKLVATYFLTAVPALNIRGSALATVLGFVVSSTLNFLAMSRVSGVRVNLGQVFIRPLIATAGMGVVAWYSYQWLSGRYANSIATLLAISLAAAIYGLLVLFTGSLTAREMRAIPKIGSPLADLLQRLHLIARD
ncbi:MAG: putative polysaccharide biosynthesis protein [Bacillota bacterium]